MAFEKNIDAILEAIRKQPPEPDRFGFHQAVKLLTDVWTKREEWTAQQPAESDDLLQVVIAAFPQPDDATPWEAVVDFSQSEEVRGKRVAFRRWLKGLASQDARPLEAREELEELLWQYQDHMRIARMAMRPAALELAIGVPAEIAEHLVKLRWGKAADALFRLQQRRMALLAAERAAPGTSVALVELARRAFPVHS